MNVEHTFFTFWRGYDMDTLILTGWGMGRLRMCRGSGIASFQAGGHPGHEYPASAGISE